MDTSWSILAERNRRPVRRISIRMTVIAVIGFALGLFRASPGAYNC
jgi:hypothetical protein